jgi:5-methylcytosine-specific restriction endonuclease McrA
MRKRSDKAIEREAARAACIRAVSKRDGYRCRAKIRGICSGDYEDVHELVMRSAGGSIIDPANCIAVCRRCHDWIHLHKSEAFDLGLIQSPKQEAARG